MKFNAAFALALALPAVVADIIRDPAVLARLRARQERAFDLITAAGEDIPLLNPYNDTSPSDISGDRRVPMHVIAIVKGLILVGTAGMAEDILKKIGTTLANFFWMPGSDMIWANDEYCRTYFQTHGGGSCEIRTYERDSEDATATHHPDNGCAWPGAPEGFAATNYFDDPGVGEYSVMFAATDQYIPNYWSDIDTCVMEGLCHPVYTFFRDDFEIVLDTWKVEGVISACQYSGGEDCQGICFAGVKDQFSTGGKVWGGDCAIPCIDDSALPERLRM